MSSMKIKLIISTLVVVLYAKKFTMETRSSGSLRARLITANLYEKFLEDEDLRRVQFLRKGSQPFLDYADDFYLGNITVGTPPQNVTIVLDTGSSDMWVIDAACTSAACNGQPESPRPKQKFDPNKSSTFTKTKRSFSLRYGSGSCKGYLGTDTISFGGITIQKQMLGVSTTIANVFGYQPVDGIVGLAWPALSVEGVTPPMQNILETLDQPIFTVWMDRKLKISMGGDAGLITYGGLDEKNCEPEIKYVPLSAETYWQFPMEGFSIGNFSDKTEAQVISDTGTSWIGAPSAAVRGVAEQTGATYDPRNNVLLVECNTMRTQPDLVFTIDGAQYNVPSVQYVLDLGLGSGQCILTFFEMSSGGFMPDWILGDTWIRTYCNIHDIGQKRIGFARARHSEL